MIFKFWIVLFEKSFNELLFEAHETHIKNHNKDTVQVCTLLSVKTGGCPEDCGYCSQSIHSDEPIEATPLMSLDEVREKATMARDQGSTRFCMGAAWRRPSNKNIDRVIKMIEVVHELGMESCVTLGMLSQDQAERLSKSLLQRLEDYWLSLRVRSMTLPAEHLILKNVDEGNNSNAPKLSEALETYLRLKSEGRDHVFVRGATRNIKTVIKYLETSPLICTAHLKQQL